VLFFVHKSRNDVIGKIAEAVTMVQSISPDGLRFYYLNSYVILLAHV